VKSWIWGFVDKEREGRREREERGGGAESARALGREGDTKRENDGKI